MTAMISIRLTSLTSFLKAQAAKAVTPYREVLSASTISKPSFHLVETHPLSPPNSNFLKLSQTNHDYCRSALFQNQRLPPRGRHDRKPGHGRLYTHRRPRRKSQHRPIPHFARHQRQHNIRGLRRLRDRPKRLLYNIRDSWICGHDLS